MKSEPNIDLRTTGIAVVGDVPWGTHLCHFYETKQDLLDTLVPYFKAGLESKEFCIWVVADPLTAEEARRALEKAVPDLDKHFVKENIEIIDGPEWYLSENVFNLERVTRAWDKKLDQALARGYEGLRVSGDVFWLREKDRETFLAYEKQLNESITDSPMTLLCTYPLAKSDAAEILNVVETHQFVTARRHGEWEVIQSPEPLQVRTEIKRLNDELQRVPYRTPERPAIQRYGVAVLSVIAAVLIVRWMEIDLHSASHVSLFLCAVMFSAWFGGVRPGLLSIALSLVGFDYFFVTPTYSLAAETNEIPRLIMFALSATFVGCLSAAQRGKAESLRRARDVLKGTVQELKRTNVALQSENAERKRAEALLHAKEQEFRAIVENAPDQILRYDREFRRTYVNPAVAKAYGLPAEALIGKAIGSVIQDSALDVTNDEVAQVRERIASVFDTGKSYEYEMTWPMSTGLRHLSVRLFPELDLNGSVVNVLGIARDITERKTAEEALRRSEDRIRLIIDTIPTMAWTLRPDGTVDFVNQRWLDYTGEVGIEDPNRTVHPEDLPGVMEKWLKNRAAGEPSESELRIRRADGEYRWFLVRTAPLRDEQGNLVKWYGVSTDIEDLKRADGALKESQRRLEEAQRIAHVGHWDRDLKTGLITWSDEIYRILGLGLQERESPRIDWLEAVHPEDRPKLSLLVEEGERGIRRFDMEFRIVRPDGEVRFLHSQGDVIRDERGQAVRMFGTMQDISERKLAEDSLREALLEINRLKDQLYKENIALREEIVNASMFEEIIGASPALQEVLVLVAKVAPTDSTVLITGETGTGKELIARAIHKRSNRASHVFMTVNCAAIPPGLIASELFGHEKGAFTGAGQLRLGRFELAEGGTIFLDEIGELPAETQIALLRVLQEHEFERVGGTKTIPADVRVIAATNRDLRAAIDAGTFRRDLFYRLNVFPIEMPSLRDRSEDIPLLVEYFIHRYASKMGKKILRIDKKTLDSLASSDWPGNIRELQNVIERSVILNETETFTIDTSWLSHNRHQTPQARILSDNLATHEKEMIEAALAESRGRVSGPTGAAARLGIPPSTLDSKIRALKIDKHRFKPT